MPSSARLRQRFDEQAETLIQAVDDCLAPMLANLCATVTPMRTGHVALHADVFCLDNSKTHKAGVARTYHGYDGYAPIGAYLQACLRPRDRFWDIPVPKIDSAFDNLFVPQPSWSPSTAQQLRKLVAAPYLAPI